MTLRVTSWNQHFENNRTRDLKEMRFVIVPNKQDGDGYTELLDDPNGAAHYGAWIAIIQVASKCGIRGTLLRDGDKPHDSGSLSRLTRIPKEVFDEAVPRLISIGWLETEPANYQQDSTIPHEGAGIPRAAAEKRGVYMNGMEGNGKEEIQQRPKRTAETRGSRLPEDFIVTPDLRVWASEHAPRVDLEVALAEFQDFWKGVPGAKGRKLDWPATFRNRLRELEGRKNGRNVVAEHPNAYKPGKMVL